MKILYSGRASHFQQIEGTTLVALPTGQGQGVPVVPDFRAVLHRWQTLAATSRRGGDAFDLVVVEAFGGAYFHGKLRRSMKMVFERGVMARLLGIVRRDRARLAVIDQHDDLTIHPVNEPLLEACDLYLKRELAIDRWRSLESLHGSRLRIPSLGYRMQAPHGRLVRKLAPISLGLGEQEPEALRLGDALQSPVASAKTHDIFYAGADEHRPLRESIREQLHAAGGRVSVNSPRERMDYGDFARAIHSAWLCISPAGLGWDCYRHYEAGLFGAVPVLSRADIMPYQPFVHGSDAIYYDPERPVLEQLEPWLGDKSRLLDMAQRARARVLRHHTRAARSRYLVECVRQLPPVR